VSAFHSYQPSAGTRQRVLRTALRHIGLPAASSLRALIVDVGSVGCDHQPGIKPQRIVNASSAPSLVSPAAPAASASAALRRITGNCIDGAAL
jgi:hypothetical protein